MTLDLASVPRRNKRISTPGLKGMDYADQVGLCHDLKTADRHFTDYVLKPATDEMWNLIDGSRSVAEIIEYALLEFDLRSDRRLWLRVFSGWRKAGLIRIGGD